jgi:hypothetical protein
LRAEALKKHAPLRAAYLHEYEESAGTQSFANARSNYALLVTSHANTYKCFVERAWHMGSSAGVQGFRRKQSASSKLRWFLKQWLFSNRHRQTPDSSYWG